MGGTTSTYFHSLSFKLILLLSAVLIAALTLITYYNISVQQDHLLGAIRLSATRSGDFIKKSLRHSMLYNRREDVLQSISDLGTEPGIDRIRLYNKKGRIMFSSNTEEVGRQVDMAADACVMCHGSDAGFQHTGSNQYTREFQNPRGEHLLGLINPIENERSCWDADCHAHGEKEVYLGVLDVRMNLAQFDANIADSSRALVISALLTLAVVGAVSAGFIIFVIERPINKFIAGTKAIAAGDLHHRIELRSRDELGDLAHSFNAMTDELRGARMELTRWSNTLADRVEEKTRELKNIQAQILHMDKMASLGTLSASIAHELNNPLSGILTFSKLISKRLRNSDLTPEMRERTHKELVLIADEAKRCGEIVKNLLFFARKQSGERQPVDLHQLIEKCVQLVRHRTEMQQISLEFASASGGDGVPLIVECDGAQVQQALIALLVNAIEAMPEGGTITIRTETREEGSAAISIRDTGCGIPESDLSRIFEPFYSTKDAVTGTGLGLSIVYGIAQSHGGNILVESTLGKGSTFTLLLPVASPTPRTSSIGEQSS